MAATDIAPTEGPTVIAVESVAKKFVLRKDNSVKDRVLQFRKSKQHEENFWALRDVNLELKAGTTIGLIGPNGSGKSTLLKIIGGIIEADKGTVLTRGRIAALLELGAGFHPDLSGRDNIYLNAAILGMSQEETDAQFDDIVAFSGIGQFIDTAVKFYSSGMYVRLAFSVAIHSDPDILLVDEVLAVGDEAFQQKCLDKIEEFQSEGRTIVLVSHTMGQITSLCDRAVVLRRGDVAFVGDPFEAVDVMRRGFISATGDQSKEPGRDVSAGDWDQVGEINQPVRITSVTPLLPRPGEMTAGQDLTVDIHFEALEPLENWDVTLGLVSALGMTVLATSAIATGIVREVIEGKQRIRFFLPDLRAGQGGYSLTVAVYDGNQRQLCVAEGVAGFQMMAGHESIGPVYSQVVGVLQGDESSS